MRSGSTVLRAADRCRDNRGADDDGGAFTRRRFDLEFSPDESGALAHADKANPMAAALDAGWIEPNAVILDDERQILGAPLQHDVDMVRSRVLDHVVQRLLRKAINRGFELRRQAIEC